IAILDNARRFNIPTYTVRSKADQHIRNVMRDMEYDSEGGDDDVVERRDRFVRANLIRASLPDQRVYIVSNTTIFSIVADKTPEEMIDEVDLFRDLLNEAYSRRVSTRSDELLLMRGDSGSRT
ncbi:hypothetical protein HD554DRAFT_2092777, partial [Boletus coccyginus]